MGTTLCYGCGLDPAEPQGADGNLDQSQIDWLRFMPDGWDGTPPVVYAETDGDSYSKLKADINKWLHLDKGSVHDGHDPVRRSLRDRIFWYIDRQAANTQRALGNKGTIAYWVEQYDNALDERDRLREQVEQLKKGQPETEDQMSEPLEEVCINCGKKPDLCNRGFGNTHVDEDRFMTLEYTPNQEHEYLTVPLGYICETCRERNMQLPSDERRALVEKWAEERMKTDPSFAAEVRRIKAYEPKAAKLSGASPNTLRNILYGNPQPDMVNHPPHYTQGGIECIEAIEASMSAEEFAGYLKGNVMKYLWRYRNKGRETEDLSKAHWYLNKLTQKVGKEDE